MLVSHVVVSRSPSPVSPALGTITFVYKGTLHRAEQSPSGSVEYGEYRAIRSIRPYSTYLNFHVSPWIRLPSGRSVTCRGLELVRVFVAYHETAVFKLLCGRACLSPSFSSQVYGFTHSFTLAAS